MASYIIDAEFTKKGDGDWKGCISRLDGQTIWLWRPRLLDAANYLEADAINAGWPAEETRQAIISALAHLADARPTD